MLQMAIDPAVVRPAGVHDEEAVLDMARLLHQECGIRKGDGKPLRFSEKKVRALIHRAIKPAADDRIWLGVIGEPGNVQASACLEILQPYYSDEEFLAEHWNFVLPAYRKSNTAKHLMAFSKALAATCKLPCCMGIMSTERQPAKMRFLERHLGCKPMGGYFVFNSDAKEED